MNYFAYLKSELENILGWLGNDGSLPADLDASRVNFEPPRDPAHGDVATNAAMVLGKQVGLPPRDLAAVLVEQFEAHDDVASAEIAGPGFINLRLTPDFWQARLSDVFAAGEKYGHSDIGAGASVNVEYVSANPTGPLHAAHGRGAVVGDVLASLLAATGHDVTREYYINDAGAQVDTLGRSAFLRYREALGEDVGEIPEGLYPGEYLKDVGRALAKEHGESLKLLDEAEWLPITRDTAIDMQMADIREDLGALGIEMDVYTSERQLVADDKVAAALKALDAQGHIYQGILEPPKGMKPEDWEAREQTLFRATDFGDDVDRPLMKSDGSYTYFASDIANHFDKFERGHATMIDVWGADHGGYVKRMQAAVSAVTGGQGSLDVKICQLVKLMKAGQPVKMSKRAGTFVTLRDVIDQVGRDVIRFIMLTRKNDATLDFDLDKVTEESRDNPVWYVQYANARAHSVMRQAAEAMPKLDLSDGALGKADLTPLTDPAELDLIKALAGWPAMVEGAALAHEPHRLAYYLNDIAGAFHALWNRGKESPELRFIRDDEAVLTEARLALVRATSLVIAAGLGIFGVKARDELR